MKFYSVKYSDYDCSTSYGYYSTMELAKKRLNKLYDEKEKYYSKNVNLYDKPFVAWIDETTFGVFVAMDTDNSDILDLRSSDININNSYELYQIVEYELDKDIHEY